MVIGSIVVSVVAVVSLIVALAVNGGSDDEGGGGDGGPTATASVTKAAGYREGDSSKTIETSECTEPQESYLDPDKVTMPDFTFKYWPSVVECLDAAGWKYEKKDVNENTFGQGTVMRQTPKAREDFDPDDPPTITFEVSTGNPQ
jgi:hypothetical protein